MKVENIEGVKILIADEGKCFKNENIKAIVSYITLSKFDREENYEEVDIADYDLELKKEQAQERLGENATTQEIEGNILENDTNTSAFVSETTSQEDSERSRLQSIIAHAVEEALNK